MWWWRPGRDITDRGEGRDTEKSFSRRFTLMSADEKPKMLTPSGSGASIYREQWN